VTRSAPEGLLHERSSTWYHNLKADPEAVTIRDGPKPFDVRVRELTGDERAAW
jgi:hypothetical protein